MNINYDFINILRQAEPIYNKSQNGGQPIPDNILPELFQLVINPPTNVTPKQIETAFRTNFNFIKGIIDSYTYKPLLKKIQEHDSSATVYSIKRELKAVLDSINTKKTKSQEYNPTEKSFVAIMNERKKGRVTLIETNFLNIETPAPVTSASVTPVPKAPKALSPKELLCQELINSVFWTRSSTSTEQELKSKKNSSLFYPINPEEVSGEESTSLSIEELYNTKIELSLSNNGNVHLVLTPNNDTINYTIRGMYKIKDEKPLIELSVFRKGQETVERGYKSYYYVDDDIIRSAWYDVKETDPDTGKPIDTSITPSKIVKKPIENGYLMFKQLEEKLLVTNTSDLNHHKSIEDIHSDLEDMLIFLSSNNPYILGIRSEISPIFEKIKQIFATQESKDAHDKDLQTKMEKTNRFQRLGEQLTEIETMDAYLDAENEPIHGIEETNHHIINLQAYRFATYYSELAKDFKFVINHMGIKQRKSNRIFIANYLKEKQLRTPFLTSDIYLHQFHKSPKTATAKFGHNRYQIRESYQIHQMFDLVELAKSIMFTFVSTVETIIGTTSTPKEFSIGLSKIYSELAWSMMNYTEEELLLRSKVYTLKERHFIPILGSKTGSIIPFFCHEAGHVDVSIKKIIQCVETTKKFYEKTTDSDTYILTGGSKKLKNVIDQAELKQACKTIVSDRPHEKNIQNFNPLGGLEGLILRNELSSSTVKEFYENFYSMSETDHYRKKQISVDQRIFKQELKKGGTLLVDSLFPTIDASGELESIKFTSQQEIIDKINSIDISDKSDISEYIPSDDIDINKKPEILEKYAKVIREIEQLFNIYTQIPSSLREFKEKLDKLKILYQTKLELYNQKKERYIEALTTYDEQKSAKVKEYQDSIIQRSIDIVRQNQAFSSIIEDSNKRILDELSRVRDDVLSKFTDISKSLIKEINDTDEMKELKRDLFNMYKQILKELESIMCINLDLDTINLDKIKEIHKIKLQFILNLAEQKLKELKRQLINESRILDILKDKSSDDSNKQISATIIAKLNLDIDKYNAIIKKCSDLNEELVLQDLVSNVELINTVYEELKKKLHALEINDEWSLSNDFVTNCIYVDIENLRKLLAQDVITIDIDKYEQTFTLLIGIIATLSKTISTTTKETKGLIARDIITEEIATYVQSFELELTKSIAEFTKSPSMLDKKLELSLKKFLLDLKEKINTQYNEVIGKLVTVREKRLELINRITINMNKEGVNAKDKKMYRGKLFAIKRQLRLEQAEMDRFNKLLLQTKRMDMLLNKTLKTVLAAERKLKDTNKQLKTQTEVTKLEGLLKKYLEQQSKTFNPQKLVVLETTLDNIPERERKRDNVKKELYDELLLVDKAFIDSYKRVQSVLKIGGERAATLSELSKALDDSNRLTEIPEKFLASKDISIEFTARDTASDILTGLREERKKRITESSSYKKAVHTLSSIELPETPYVEKLRKLFGATPLDESVKSMINILNKLNDLQELLDKNIGEFKTNLSNPEFNETLTMQIANKIIDNMTEINKLQKSSIYLAHTNEVLRLSVIENEKKINTKIEEYKKYLRGVYPSLQEIITQISSMEDKEYEIEKLHQLLPFLEDLINFFNNKFGFNISIIESARKILDKLYKISTDALNAEILAQKKYLKYKMKYIKLQKYL